ncbi:hypothetical protein GCM10020218_092060 [Dactylosporangium vinaceum]
MGAGPRGGMRRQLDELYGKGRGEGAAAEAAGRAGREAPFPNVREWAEELSALFGPGIREEVLARAAESGRRDAVMLLEPEAVNPSVELLQTVLSLAGGMPGELAVCGCGPSSRGSSRSSPGGWPPAAAGAGRDQHTAADVPAGRTLDLPRTLRANLATHAARRGRARAGHPRAAGVQDPGPPRRRLAAGARRRRIGVDGGLDHLVGADGGDPGRGCRR